MNPIVVRRSHRLSLAEARRLAETMAKRLQGEFGGTYAWDGDTLRFRRTGASGHVAVTKGALEVHVELGLLLTPLRPLIEREISAFCDEQFRAPQRSRPASGWRGGRAPPDPRPRVPSRRAAGPGHPGPGCTVLTGGEAVVLCSQALLGLEWPARA